MDRLNAFYSGISYHNFSQSVVNPVTSFFRNHVSSIGMNISYRNFIAVHSSSMPSPVFIISAVGLTILIGVAIAVAYSLKRSDEGPDALSHRPPVKIENRDELFLQAMKDKESDIESAGAGFQYLVTQYEHGQAAFELALLYQDNKDFYGKNPYKKSEIRKELFNVNLNKAVEWEYVPAVEFYVNRCIDAKTLDLARPKIKRLIEIYSTEKNNAKADEWAEVLLNLDQN